MKLGIDIDDTMADTFDYLMPYIAEYFKIDLNYLKENNISYTTLTKEMQSKEHDFAQTYYDKVIPHTPFKENVSKYLNKIKQMGNEIIVITARDKTLYKAEYSTTIEELKIHNINYDKLFCDLDKAKICLEENIDLFIDDSIYFCDSVEKLGIKTLLFNSKANETISCKYPRVYSWREIYEIVKNNCNNT